MRHRAARFDAYADFQRDQREQRISARIRLSVPRSPEPILSQKQRAAVVEKVRPSMEQWTRSPFEREAATRSALRGAFCLGGDGWAAADNEAARITAMALDAMGAQRPSWEEGQWTYALSEDYCKWCQRPMELGHAGHYCSPECSKSALMHRDFKERHTDNAAYREAYRSVRRFAMPKKPCRKCGGAFHPREQQQEFCSRSCAQTFKVEALRATEGTKVVCSVCRDEFRALHPTKAKYCCTACQVTGYRMRKGIWDPKRLNRQAFEQLVIGSAPLRRRLTPERFDGLMAA